MITTLTFSQPELESLLVREISKRKLTPTGQFRTRKTKKTRLVYFYVDVEATAKQPDNIPLVGSADITKDRSEQRSVIASA